MKPIRIIRRTTAMSPLQWDLQSTLVNLSTSSDNHVQTRHLKLLLPSFLPDLSQWLLLSLILVPISLNSLRRWHRRRKVKSSIEPSMKIMTVRTIWRNSRRSGRRRNWQSGSTLRNPQRHPKGSSLSNSRTSNERASKIHAMSNFL